MNPDDLKVVISNFGELTLEPQKTLCNCFRRLYITPCDWLTDLYVWSLQNSLLIHWNCQKEGILSVYDAYMSDVGLALTCLV